MCHLAAPRKKSLWGALTVDVMEIEGQEAKGDVGKALQGRVGEERPSSGLLCLCGQPLGSCRARSRGGEERGLRGTALPLTPQRCTYKT